MDYEQFWNNLKQALRLCEQIECSDTVRFDEAVSLIAHIMRGIEKDILENPEDTADEMLELKDYIIREEK